MTNNEKALEDLENQSFENDDSNEVPPSDIVAYNELRSCADLFRMHQKGILEIQPDFQRKVVWKDSDQTRFIDSLIKQLPIPSMCFSLDFKTQKWIVIDGLQRISAIVRFLKGADWKLSKLDDITPAIAGKSVAAIKDEDSDLHKYYGLIENLSIPITILRCDYTKKEHMEYLFTIFHRLNSGGMRLNNQEIRNCIYEGSFNTMLKELDQFSIWRRLNKMKPKEDYRFTKQELILRFFTFSDKHSKYSGGLSKFLNTYMQDNRNLSDEKINNKKEFFTKTVECVDEKIFDKRSPPKISITLMEALLIGVGKNLDSVLNMTQPEAKRRFSELQNTPHFSSEVLLREGLSKRQRVIDRLNAAIDVFAS